MHLIQLNEAPKYSVSDPVIALGMVIVLLLVFGYMFSRE